MNLADLINQAYEKEEKDNPQKARSYIGASIVGKAKTQYPDYEMSDLGAFPGVFLNGKFHIQGEVWEVSDEVMEQLDAIEGYPDFYDREPTMTTQGKAFMFGAQERRDMAKLNRLSAMAGGYAQQAASYGAQSAAGSGAALGALTGLGYSILNK